MISTKSVCGIMLQVGIQLELHTSLHQRLCIGGTQSRCLAIKLPGITQQVSFRPAWESLSLTSLPDSLSEDLTSSFDEIERCSHWMFGLFMAGACLSFVLIPVVILGMKSRWFSLGLSIITFLNMVCVLAATIIATVVFVLIRDLLKDYEEIINLVPEIGSTMFAMMWIGAAFSIFAFLIQVFLSCFCASQRDVKRGVNKTEAYLW